MSLGKNFDFKEVYQQRYETYRHLDQLRWQVVQIGVATASAIFAFSEKSNSSISWWALVACGVVLLFTGVILGRIRSGIVSNSIPLKLAGEQLGDMYLPHVGNRWKSVAFWIEISTYCLGLVALVFALKEKFFP